MKYRLNPRNNIIYSRDEYVWIEMNWGIFQHTGLHAEKWEDLDQLPITTEEERKKLQFIYDTGAQRNSIWMVGDPHKDRYDPASTCDILGDFVPPCHDMGRPHFSGNQEADQRGVNDQQADI